MDDEQRLLPPTLAFDLMTSRIMGVETKVRLRSPKPLPPRLNQRTEAPPASVAMTLPRGDAPDVLAAQAAAMAVAPHETRAQRRERLRAKG